MLYLFSEYSSHVHARRSDRDRFDHGPSRQEERIYTDVRATFDILVNRFGSSSGKYGLNLRVQILRRHWWR